MNVWNRHAISEITTEWKKKFELHINFCAERNQAAETAILNVIDYNKCIANRLFVWHAIASTDLALSARSAPNLSILNSYPNFPAGCLYHHNHRPNHYLTKIYNNFLFVHPLVFFVRKMISKLSSQGNIYTNFLFVRWGIFFVLEEVSKNLHSS